MDGRTSRRDAQTRACDRRGHAARSSSVPRVDFGRVPTRLEVQDDGLRVLGAGDSVQLVAPGVSWTVLEDGPHQRAVAPVDLRAGEPLVCEMQVGVEGAVPWRADEPERRRATMEYWSGWASTLRLPRSRRGWSSQRADPQSPLLPADGRILAAATTSLPEEIRGRGTGTTGTAGCATLWSRSTRC